MNRHGIGHNYVPFRFLTFDIQNENWFLTCRVFDIPCNIVLRFEKTGTTRNDMIQFSNAYA